MGCIHVDTHANVHIITKPCVNELAGFITLFLSLYSVINTTAQLVYAQLSKGIRAKLVATNASFPIERLSN
jgi:hypothetical protein